MKSLIIALAGALALAGSALPALAATSLDVPVVAAAPSLDPHAAGSFNGAAVAKLAWDATSSQAADEPATVRVESDGSNLYVRFDVSQSEPLIGSDGGDSVAVDLWPNGASGERYHLGVSPNGTHTSDSTPNTAGWETSGNSYTHGYAVTMKIPLSAVGNGSSSAVQFSRWIASSAQAQVWSHQAGAGDDEVGQAGRLTFASSVGQINPK